MWHILPSFSKRQSGAVSQRITEGGSKGTFNQNKWHSIKLAGRTLKRCFVKVQMILVSFETWCSLRFAQHVTEKESMKKGDLALAIYHSNLSCELVFSNDGLEKEFECYLYKVHNHWKVGRGRRALGSIKYKRPHVQTGYRYPLRSLHKGMTCSDLHFRKIIWTEM